MLCCVNDEKKTKAGEETQKWTLHIGCIFTKEAHLANQLKWFGYSSEVMHGNFSDI